MGEVVAQSVVEGDRHGELGSVPHTCEQLCECDNVEVRAVQGKLLVEDLFADMADAPAAAARFPDAMVHEHTGLARAPGR